MKDDCIFCKLANGVIPTNMIYEDDTFAVIMDASPVSRGHALILPKEHAANLFELPEETASKLMPLAKKLASHMKEKLDFDGLNILQNNGETAGQSVFHFHMHLVPRYKDAANNDKLLQFATAGLSADEIKEIADDLKTV
ncbi:MAG: HIT family protein [Lachnospiraceae bacterium]|nr:HIT family protein [Lachnospiraceae bacterium]